MQKIGSFNDPINISDDEDQKDIQAKLQMARNKQLIAQAKLCGSPLDLCFAVIKTTISGQMKTKQRKLTKEILKYFKQKIGINISHESFYPRLEPDYSDSQTKPNACELMIYGVDFLTTNAIKDRFKILDTVIRQIFWINDSVCKIKYGTKSQTDKIIQDQTSQIKIQEDSDELPKGWFMIKPYTIFSFQRKLYLRYATDKETHIPKENTRKYQEFYQAQSQLANYLLDEFKAMEKFKEVVKQMKNDAQMFKRHHNFDRNRSRSRDHGKLDKFYKRQNNYKDSSFHHKNHKTRKNKHQNQDDFNSFNEESFQYFHNKSQQNKRRNYEPQIVYRPQTRKEIYQQLPVKKMKNKQIFHNSGFKNSQQRVYYDSCQFDSNFCFNDFDQRNISEKGKNSALDFDIEYNRSDYDYQNQKSQNQLSFHMKVISKNEIIDKKQNIDLSFNYNNTAKITQIANQTENIELKAYESDKNLKKVDSDFFELNDSVISYVQQKNPNQDIDISFNFQNLIQRQENENKQRQQVDNFDFKQYSY